MMDASGYDIFVNNRIIKFLDALERREPVARLLFEKMDWSPGDGLTAEFSIGALSAVAGTVGERQRIPAVNPAQSGTLLKSQLQYGQAFEITKRMKLGNKWQSADYYAEQTAMGIIDGLDYDMTHQIFSQAENATYSHRTEGTINISCIDALAPASTAHTVTGTGTTQYSNRLNGTTGLVLSTDNFVAAKQLPNQNAVDEYGTPIRCAYRQLLIAQNEDMVRKGRQIFGSPKEPEVFENAMNIYNDGQHQLFVLTHGDTDTDLSYESALRYRWVLKSGDPRLRQLNAYQIAQEAGIQLESVDENNLAARVVGDLFAAYACPGWQDKVYSTATTSP